MPLWEVSIFCEVEATEDEIKAMDPYTVLDKNRGEWVIDIQEIEGDDDAS